MAVRAQRDVLGRPTPKVLGAVRVGLARRRTPLAVDQRASAVAPHRRARDTVDRLIAAGRMSHVAVVADCSRLLAGRRSAGHRGVEVVVLTGSQYACQYSFTRTMYMAMMVRDIMPLLRGNRVAFCLLAVETRAVPNGELVVFSGVSDARTDRHRVRRNRVASIAHAGALQRDPARSL